MARPVDPVLIDKKPNLVEKIKYLYRALRYRYLVDVKEIRFILQNLRTGEIAVDIGCHKGGYLYWLQQKVGKTGKVYAFEPKPRLYQYLQKIKRICRYSNVTIENKGLSSRQETADFLIPVTKSGSSPGARIGRPEAQGEFEKLQIEVVTLDDYFLANRIFPNLIKIDVEGHELKALAGGRELLKTCRPTLLMECEHRHLDGISIFEVFRFLLDIGYKGYFHANRQWRPIEEFKLDIHQKTGEGRFWEQKGYVNNFVFLHKE